MTETIDLSSDSAPSVFVLEALIKAGLDDSLTVDDRIVTIVLTVNGKKVPFGSVIEDIWCRASAEIECRAKELAEAMVTAAGLGELYSAMREAEWKIKDALSRVEG